MALEEVVVVHVHLGEIDADFDQVLEVLLIEDVVEFEQVEGVHHEFIGGGGGHVVVEGTHYVAFLGTDALLGDLLVGDFLMNKGKFEGVDLLVLASHEHGAHPNRVQIRWLKHLFRVLKVPVHIVDCQEK